MPTLDVYFQIEELKKENANLKSQLQHLEQEIMKNVPYGDMDEHDVVQTEMDRNTGKRVTWKTLIGSSLTKLVAGHYAEGKTAEETYNEIQKLMISKGITDDDLFRRMKIGVCARRGEIKSETNEIKSKKLLRPTL